MSLTVRELTSAEDLRATGPLYREVFAREAVNPRLLAALSANGGAVIGAFDRDELVGFVYGFPGRDPRTGELYHYSQTAAVRREYRGSGVGRMLKLGQRDRVLAQGLSRMRWAYDPFRTGNARFNLDGLGARGRWFAANLYGLEASGDGAPHPSDRFVVEWDLAASQAGRVPRPWAPAPRAPGWGERISDGSHVLVSVPRSNSDPLTPGAPPELRGTVSAVLRDLLECGYQAVSCLPADERACVYRFVEPGS